MTKVFLISAVRLVALLAEGVDRNITTVVMPTVMSESPSSRRAWIEIACPTDFGNQNQVALLAEGVDRNRLSF